MRSMCYLPGQQEGRDNNSNNAHPSLNYLELDRCKIMKGKSPTEAAKGASNASTAALPECTLYCGIFVKHRRATSRSVDYPQSCCVVSH